MQQASNAVMSVNFEIGKGSGGLSNEDQSVQKICEENDVTKKLCISSCGSISRSHLLLRYDIENEFFEIMAL